MHLSTNDSHELLALLALLAPIVANEIRREFGEGFTAAQFRVLGLLAERQYTLSALARKRQVSVQSMCELVQAMVERGWLDRRPDPSDRRQSLLFLTENGQSHYEATHTHLNQRITAILSKLDADELAAARVALPALRRVLAEAEESSADVA
ncbi:MAG: MarR family transcriptional regulator [Chloroflexales bacterium]|nr:MarR family transcriptional regulator [Chloroflexales bacterium]